MVGDGGWWDVGAGGELIGWAWRWVWVGVWPAMSPKRGARRALPKILKKIKDLAETPSVSLFQAREAIARRMSCSIVSFVRSAPALVEAFMLWQIATLPRGFVPYPRDQAHSLQTLQKTHKEMLEK